MTEVAGLRRVVLALAATGAGVAVVVSTLMPSHPRPALAATGPGSTPAGPGRAVPAPTGAAPGTRVADGSVEDTPYGPVQVRVTVSGGRLVDVAALRMPDDREGSVRRSELAGPVLRGEALSVQGARIDTVSGATYTSEAYARSLQAALDAAR